MSGFDCGAGEKLGDEMRRRRWAAWLRPKNGLVVDENGVYRERCGHRSGPIQCVFQIGHKRGHVMEAEA